MTFRLPFLFTVLLPLIVLSPLLIAGPGLVADTRNGSAWTLARDLTVTRAECSRFLAIVSLCTMSYTGAARDKVEPELTYFIYGDWANEHVLMLRSTRDPKLVATFQPVRDLRKRQTTLVGWVVIWLGLACAAAARQLSRGAVRVVGDCAPAADKRKSALGRIADGTDPMPIVSVPDSPRPFGQRRL